MTARSIGLYEHTTPVQPHPANSDHGCQMLFTTYCQMRRISLANGSENSCTLHHTFFSAILSNYICCRFITTTAFLVCTIYRYWK